MFYVCPQYSHLTVSFVEINTIKPAYNKKGIFRSLLRVPNTSITVRRLPDIKIQVAFAVQGKKTIRGKTSINFMHI